jgi:hypothetical protein
MLPLVYEMRARGRKTLTVIKRVQDRQITLDVGDILIIRLSSNFARSKKGHPDLVDQRPVKVYDPTSGSFN